MRCDDRLPHAASHSPATRERESKWGKDVDDIVQGRLLRERGGQQRSAHDIKNRQIGINPNYGARTLRDLHRDGPAPLSTQMADVEYVVFLECCGLPTSDVS